MQDLGFYFDLGWHHIIAWNAIDHLLFVLVLSAIYLAGNWRQVLVLITAFTIGHSITLAISVYGLLQVNENWVEFLIPCTIIITAIFNLGLKEFKPVSLQLNYFLALFFGLIHGLGFANTLRYLMAKDQSIGWSLFGFNLGLEVGQVVVVGSVLIGSYLLVNKAGISRKGWVWCLSAVAAGMAVKMAWERFPA